AFRPGWSSQPASITSTATARECLSLLAPPVLTGVANTLALVRLRRANLADICRELPDHVLVSAGDRHAGRIRLTSRRGDLLRDVEPLRNLKDELRLLRLAVLINAAPHEAHVQQELAALDPAAVAGAVNLELTLVTL